MSIELWKTYNLVQVLKCWVLCMEQTVGHKSLMIAVVGDLVIYSLFLSRIAFALNLSMYLYFFVSVVLIIWYIFKCWSFSWKTNKCYLFFIFWKSWPPCFLQIFYFIMSTMLRKRIFRIKRRARLKTIRSMSVFTLYSYIRTFRQITYGIIS